MTNFTNSFFSGSGSSDDSEEENDDDKGNEPSPTNDNQNDWNRLKKSNKYTTLCIKLRSIMAL